MRLVIALGGNALQRRGDPMTVANQLRNVHAACEAIAPLAAIHEVVLTHGNGPQVGLLALQAAAYEPESAYPFDVLGAQTEGMIGYWLEQQLAGRLAASKPVAAMLTLTEVDPADPAFEAPTKFVGPVYTEQEARQHAEAEGWTVRRDGRYWRRVMPSPQPLRILHSGPIRWLLERGTVVICAGGGGIPTTVDSTSGRLAGVEAVIDKDAAAAVLARDIGADKLVIATDADGVYLDYATPQARRITRAHPDALDRLEFPAGSMGPKVAAATEFARITGNEASIGSLDDLPRLLTGDAGTVVSTAVDAPRIWTSDAPLSQAS